MPIRPPILDDRSYDDLVDDLLRRIPGHAPEWTHPRVGDPGRTLIDLFAWLVDSLLYRVNLVPERQRLVFLQMLGIPLRPAEAATVMASVLADGEDVTTAVTLRMGAIVSGPVAFESLRELTVLPVTTQAFIKAALSEADEAAMEGVVRGLTGLYQVSGTPKPYATSALWADGRYDEAGVTLGERAVDDCVWLPLLAGPEAPMATVRETLGGTADGTPQLLSVGIHISAAPVAPLEEVGQRVPVPHVWELSTGREVGGQPEYITLDVLSDNTDGLTRSGVVRLALPAKEHIGTPSDDVREQLHAGVGDRPPRLDDPELATRVASWLRLRVSDGDVTLRLGWMGINVAELDQRQTLAGIEIGRSDGTADQQIQLPRSSVERDSFALQVQEPDGALALWRMVDDLQTEGPFARAYTLDSEAGVVRFGDGMRGRVPEPGARFRVAMMRSGGGAAGNLPPGSLKDITAYDIKGVKVTAPKLKVLQAVPSRGGRDAETLPEAERRIPAELHHRNRAVTTRDYRELAAATPGARIGRVEVMPRFLPNTRSPDIPGVVSVMVLPRKDAYLPPNPRADRSLLGAVHGWLDLRRTLGTELYVIGTEYVPLGLSVAVELQPGVPREETLEAIRQSLRVFLWPLAPGGPQRSGWELGRAVQDRELEVVVAQVAGVKTVGGVNLFERTDSSSNSSWKRTHGATSHAAARITLKDWQLPELLGVTAIIGTRAPDKLTVGLGPGAGTGDLVPVPVVPDVCGRPDRR